MSMSFIEQNQGKWRSLQSRKIHASKPKDSAKWQLEKAMNSFFPK
jgi:hypothetical protein